MNFLENFNKKGLVVILYFFAGLIILNTLVLLYYKSNERDLHILIARNNSIASKAAVLERVASEIDVNPSQGAEYENRVEEIQRAYDSVQYNLKKFEYPESMLEYLQSYIGTAINVHHQNQLSVPEDKPDDFIVESEETPVEEFDSMDQEMNLDDSTSILSTPVDTTPVVQPEPVTKNVSLPALGRVCDDFAELLQGHHHTKEQEAGAGNYFWLNVMVVLQIITVVCIPFIILFSIVFRKNKSKLRDLTLAINDSNNRYVFNSMEDIDVNNEIAVKASLLDNLRRATDFIQRIANGDYSVKWEGMDERNREENKENIAGELIKMREQMREVKEQDRIRIWSTEGLSKFGEIIRNNQNNFDELSDNLISNAVKYADAKVGGLYIVEEEEGTEYLALRACYAYERKKYITKRIEIGEGLVGQTYLEGKTIHLREVPDSYITITSGLGETTPRSLLVIPLKVNERIEGVLELASLNEFQTYEVEFFEKLGEALAASIVTVRTAEKTKILLSTSQEQSEEMRAQEEEMRQNMEEIEATQEQMHRQVTELNELKNKMEHEKELFSALMDNIPDAIYFKDLESKFIRVSKYLAKHFKATEEELIGKSDFDFQDESHAREAFEDEQKIMRTREPKIDFVEREVSNDGVDHYVSTTKMPLMDAKGMVIGTFGISRDVSKLKRLEVEILNKDKKLKEEEKEYEDRIKLLERKISMKEEEIQEMKKKNT